MMRLLRWLGQLTFSSPKIKFKLIYTGENRVIIQPIKGYITLTSGTSMYLDCGTHYAEIVGESD